MKRTYECTTVKPQFGKRLKAAPKKELSLSLLLFVAQAREGTRVDIEKGRLNIVFADAGITTITPMGKIHHSLRREYPSRA